MMRGAVAIDLVTAAYVADKANARSMAEAGSTFWYPTLG